MRHWPVVHAPARDLCAPRLRARICRRLAGRLAETGHISQSSRSAGHSQSVPAHGHARHETQQEQTVAAAGLREFWRYNHDLGERSPMVPAHMRFLAASKSMSRVGDMRSHPLASWMTARSTKSVRPRATERAGSQRMRPQRMPRRPNASPPSRATSVEPYFCRVSFPDLARISQKNR